MTLVTDEFRSAAKRLGGEYGRWLEYANSLSYRQRQAVQEGMWRAFCYRCDLAFDGYRDTPLVGDRVVTRRHEEDDEDEDGSVIVAGTTGEITATTAAPHVNDGGGRISVRFPSGAMRVYSLSELCDPEMCEWKPAEREPWAEKKLRSLDAVPDMPEIASAAKASADLWERMRRRGVIMPDEWDSYVEGLRNGVHSRAVVTEERRALEHWLCLLHNCTWVGMVEDTTADNPETAPLVAEWAFTEVTNLQELARWLPADARVRMADWGLK
jgi:hypothetical protein